MHRTGELQANNGALEIDAFLFHLFFTRPERCQLPNLFKYRVSNLRAFAVWFGNHHDEQAGRPAAFIYAALDLHHRLFTLDQFLIKPRALAFEQQVAGQGKGIKIRRSS